MRLKTFTAPDMTQAMQLVKSTLGDQAIILSNREDKPRNLVIVTAAIDEDALIEREENQVATPEPQKTLNHDTGHNINQTIALLKKHNCPESFIHQVLHKAGDNDLTTILSKLFRFKTPSFEKPLILIGPHGSGKTIATARLAMQLKLSETALPVYSADTIKAGGIQQLSSLLKVLQIPLKTTENLAESLKQIAYTPALIDTPGLHPYNRDDRDKLAGLPHQFCDIALVLPAGIDTIEAHDLTQSYNALLKPNYLIITRLDQTKRLGGILTAMQNLNTNMAYASHSHSAAKPFIELNPQALKNILTEA